MGYLRFIRVATCCIVIQAALLTFASPFPQLGGDASGEGKGAPKSVKVHDAIVKGVEEQPGQREDSRTTFHRSTNVSEDAKTENGRRKEEVTSTEDMTTQRMKTVEYDTNESGRMTDETSKEAMFKNHEERKKEVKTNGTETTRRKQQVNGSRNQALSTTAAKQELLNGSVNSEKQKLTENIDEGKTYKESYVNRKDVHHGELHKLVANSKSSTETGATSSSDTYSHSDADDNMSVTNADRKRNTRNSSHEDYTEHYLKVEPGTRYWMSDRISDDRTVNSEKTETETDVSHVTAIHDLHVYERVTTVHDHDSDRRTVATSERSVTPETGTIVKSKAKHEMDRDTLKHVDRFNIELKPKVPHVADLNVKLEKEIIDKDSCSTNDTKEATTTSIALDGSKKTERKVETNVETYKMHTLEPTATKKKNFDIVLDSMHNKTDKQPTKEKPY